MIFAAWSKGQADLYGNGFPRGHPLGAGPRECSPGSPGWRAQVTPSAWCLQQCGWRPLALLGRPSRRWGAPGSVLLPMLQAPSALSIGCNQEAWAGASACRGLSPAGALPLHSTWFFLRPPLFPDLPHGILQGGHRASWVPLSAPAFTGGLARPGRGAVPWSLRSPQPARRSARRHDAERGLDGAGLGGGLASVPRLLPDVGFLFPKDVYIFLLYIKMFLELRQRARQPGRCAVPAGRARAFSTQPSASVVQV